LAPPLLPPLQATPVASGRRRIGIVWRPREERRKAGGKKIGNDKEIRLTGGWKEEEELCETRDRP